MNGCTTSRWLATIAALIFLSADYSLADQSLADQSLADQSLADQPFFTGLGILDDFSIPTDISADGSVVVGRGGSSGIFKSFRWTMQTGMVPLGDLPDGLADTRAEGVSADGSVIVGRAVTANGPVAYRWTQATGMQKLSDIAGNQFLGSAQSVSADGNIIVGQAGTRAGLEPFRWTPATGAVALGNLPGGSNSGIAVGISADGETVTGHSSSALAPVLQEGFRWTEDTGMVGLGDLPGGDAVSRPRAISADGSTIVGRSSIDFGGSSVSTAVRWTDAGGPFEITGPIGTFPRLSDAQDVSADGSVIVGLGAGGGGGTAYIWDELQGARSVQVIIQQELGLSFAGWDRLNSVDAVSDDGRTLAGVGFRPDGTAEGWILHIPEPNTAALVLFGALVVCQRNAIRRF